MAVPTVTPVTVPPEFTVATAILLLLQVPPPVVSITVKLLPVHKVKDDGIIAAGPATTVTVLVTEQPPMA